MKRIYVYLAAAAVCVLLVAVGLSYLLTTVERYLEPAPAESRVQSSFPGYLLTVRDGYVVIRSAADGAILETFDTPQDTLSPFDRQTLANGVFFDTLEDARKAAADYCG